MWNQRQTSSAAAPRKPAQKLETFFLCPFCNNSDSVECSIDVKLKVAEAVCCVCEESFATKAHGLTDPIDVYSEWIDKCGEVNQGVQDMKFVRLDKTEGKELETTILKVEARKKPAPKLETCFRCPFCHHSDSVECSIDVKRRVAEAVCCVCEESFSTKAHGLAEPIDVYSEWIDKYDEGNLLEYN